MAEYTDLYSAIDKIGEAKMDEIIRAELEGRLVIRKPPLTDTCGSCVHFQRTPGRASGFCDKRTQKRMFLDQEPKPLYVVQSRTRCRDDYQKKNDNSEKRS